MKHHMKGALVFILTLSVGLLSAIAGAGIQRAEINPPIAAETLSLSEPDKAPSSLIEKPSSAEFQELKSFSELDFPELPYNLIDVHNTDGVYREGDVVARSGEKWLTLFEMKGRYSMKLATADVKRTRSISYVGDEFDVRLKFDKPGSPIFAVREIESVKPGPVTTLYLRPTWGEIRRRNLPIGSMETGFKREFNLNENWYTLRVSAGKTTLGEPVGALVLENNGAKQVVATNYFVATDTTIIGELLWVGDLDNDGKLDLYFDEFNEKGYFSSGLYLSSNAKEGQLVGLVARFGFAGC